MVVKKIYRNGELVYDAEVKQEEVLEQKSEPKEQEPKKRGRKPKEVVSDGGEKQKE